MQRTDFRRVAVMTALISAAAFWFAPPNLIADGDVMAVENHQGNASSNGTRISASLYSPAIEPPVIVNEPEDVLVEVDQAWSLEVGVTGLEVTCQWQKYDGAGSFTNINGTGANPFLYLGYRVVSADAGWYRAVCSYAGGWATSRVATVLVVPDVVGPHIISAVAQPNVPPHTILVTFSERVLPELAREVTNYSVRDLSTGSCLTISNALSQNTLVRLVVSPWTAGRQYVLTANNLRDYAGNVIAPQTQVPVAWERIDTLVPLDARWHYLTDWQSPPPPPSWRTNGSLGLPFRQGRALFCNDFDSLVDICAGFPYTYLSEVSTTNYFSTQFAVSNTVPANQLELLAVFRHATVFYLNGTEVARFDPDNGPIYFDNSSITWHPTRSCLTTSVASACLIMGANVLAAEVYYDFGRGYPGPLLFGAQLHLRSLVTPLQANPPPRLALHCAGDDLTLSWDGGGYMLEQATNLSLPWFIPPLVSGAGSPYATNWPPGLSPWVEVQPDLANPYVTCLTNTPARFWRLKLKQP